MPFQMDFNLFRTGLMWCAAAGLCSALATLMMKYSSSPPFNNRMFFLGGAIGCYAVGFWLYCQALRNLQMSVAYPLMTMFTVLGVMSFGYIFFSESITFYKLSGIVLMIFSCFLISK